MKSALSFLLAFIGAFGLSAAAISPTIRTAAELAQAVFDAEDLNRPFDIEATVTYVNLPRIMFKDATGGMYADDKRNASGPTPPQPGDRIRLSGHIILSDALRLPVADCQRIVQIDHGRPRTPQQTTLAEVTQGKFDYQLVSVIGEITDSIRDDIDRNYRLLVLTDGNARIIVPIQTSLTTNDFGLSSIGRRVKVTGVCDPVLLGGHKNLGRGILPLPQTGLSELPSERRDPFRVPDLGGLKRKTARELLTFGRRRITGTVLAVWGGENGILSCAHERIVRVTFAEAPLPPVDACIEVSGFPFTDSYTPCLGRALWRPEDLVVLRQPPWWTFRKFLALIALMILITSATIAWNISLQRLSERRGHAIATSERTRIEADLKTQERTRLAIELHDSIAQDLTGATMELKAADLVADSDRPALHRLLTLAIQSPARTPHRQDQAHDSHRHSGTVHQRRAAWQRLRIADDHTVVRIGLTALIESQSDPLQEKADVDLCGSGWKPLLPWADG